MNNREQDALDGVKEELRQCAKAMKVNAVISTLLSTAILLTVLVLLVYSGF